MVMHGGMPNSTDNNRYKFETRFFTNTFVNHSTVYRDPLHDYRVLRTCNSNDVRGGTYANALQYVRTNRRHGDGDTISYPANAGEYQEQQAASSTSRTVPSLPDADLAEGDYNGQMTQPSPQVPPSTASTAPYYSDRELALITESRENLRREMLRLQGEDAMAIATAILELRASTAGATSSTAPALPTTDQILADQLQAVDGDSDRLMAT